MKLSEELQWRGFVNQTTLKSLSDLDDKPTTFYWGVDPSADSMQIGNLAAAMMVRHFIDHGHKAVLLVGGATGMIGDPDGKKQERNLQSLETIAHNKKAISQQYRTVFAGQDFETVDNYDWFKDMGYLQFLRDVGKHVPMRQMLGREFVQSRLGEEGAGISYAEFSYSLIQGYDFLHLFREYGVTLQVCGADQWGNSIAGVDLIRRIEGAEAHVYSTPLIVNKETGIKFGKSEEGAVWLDPAKTSPYKFYQFWINCDDTGIEDYMKIYTLLPKEELDEVMAKHRANPSLRTAQKRLAYEVTKLVHGKQQAETQQAIADVLFGKDDALELGEEHFAVLTKELPVVEVTSGDDLMGALVAAGLAGSKTEARRFVEEGAIYVNNQKIGLDVGFLFDGSHRFVVVRRGKNTNAVLKIKR